MGGGYVLYFYGAQAWTGRGHGEVSWSDSEKEGRGKERASGQPTADRAGYQNGCNCAGA